MMVIRGWTCFFILAVALQSTAQDFMVGVSLPLSGSFSSYGKSTLNGIELKVAQINKGGGLAGRKIALIVEDNKGDAAECGRIYRGFAGNDKVSLVLGPIISTNVLSIWNDVISLKVPVLSPTATNDSVTSQNPYMFRACFNDSFQGGVAAQYAVKMKSMFKAAVMVDMNSDYSKGLAKSFRTAFTALGGQIVAEEKYMPKDTEFDAQLKRIKSKGADVLFVPGYPPELPLIIRQAKAAGLTCRLCGTDGWDSESVINGSGENIEGCFIVGAFSVDDERDEVKRFVNAFQDAFKHAPSSFDALGYDAMGMAAHALEKGGTPAAVRDRLSRIKDFEGVTGRISVTDDGDVRKSAVILEAEKSKSQYVLKYKATVSP